MSTPEDTAELEQILVAQVALLVPEFLKDQQNSGMSSGNAAFCVIGRDGRVAGPEEGAQELRS